jgi:vacuolar-type H+-ATPase subunit H
MSPAPLGAIGHSGGSPIGDAWTGESPAGLEGTGLCSNGRTTLAKHAWVAVNDDLDQLLEAERRLAARLEEARATATRRLETARADAQAVARRAEEDVQAGRARASAETQAELEAGLQRIEARAEERVQVYTGVTGERLRELSVFVLRTLLEDATAVRP